MSFAKDCDEEEDDILLIDEKNVLFTTVIKSIHDNVDAINNFNKRVMELNKEIVRCKRLKKALDAKQKCL